MQGPCKTPLQGNLRTGARFSPWHDYRRGFAVQMRQKGLDVGHVANLLGHRTLAMAMLYAQEGEEAAAIDAYRRATG